MKAKAIAMHCILH